MGFVLQLEDLLLDDEFGGSCSPSHLPDHFPFFFSFSAVNPSIGLTPCMMPNQPNRQASVVQHTSPATFLRYHDRRSLDPTNIEALPDVHILAGAAELNSDDYWTFWPFYWLGIPGFLMRKTLTNLGMSKRSKSTLMRRCSNIATSCAGSAWLRCADLRLSGPLESFFSSGTCFVRQF